MTGSQPSPARVVLHPQFVVGTIDRRLFGTFVEHMGRGVYTGIFEPGHPSATAAGFRADVLELTRELGPTVARYPGGNFVSGYRWEDGVGPAAERPARLDLAWRSLETNEFGLNEFIEWSRLADVEPMLAVNLGTRGPQEAADLVEYTNHPSGSRLSELRRDHGYDAPHAVRVWCLGNEMDAEWQVGAKTAQEYGRLAAETAKLMRLVDPDIELVACGSSMRSMPTFAQWEAEVLEHCFDVVDYISMHAYVEEYDGDLPRFLASGVLMDRQIEQITATLDHVAARRRSDKTVDIAFDEWNVWFQEDFAGPQSLTFEHAPRLIEDTFDVAAALVVGTMLNSLIRHCDRVRIACQAQLVNVIGAIRSEPGGPAWRQSIFHPFAHVARCARGVALRPIVEGPVVEVDGLGEVPTLDVAATRDPDDGSVALFVVNRSVDSAADTDVDLSAFGPLRCLEHLELAADGDVRRANTAQDPEAVSPRQAAVPALHGGHLHVTVKPLSWNAIRLVPISTKE
ncbi:alpha-N-arabinofuranosidase [Nostocoides sp. Soil756]|uniref:arabinosylfuranosidase ArfA n=1 Tax=Nostocoides sp. Soil756 TaxID=1736399 RepID=UPI0006F337FC|nr:alpha-N-arabinofuranosidase [Tetrasphaera sp. Soil756]KRE62782.1 alpha-L-arabinofuranosidase [Tetrasphaera sp. Soil756]